ncbi:MAG: DUF4830 domain-containing protein [Ruminiclostridium sp.]|nr:DUF4830 domain-containing protein [Ruminiclostridium sp.]
MKRFTTAAALATAAALLFSACSSSYAVSSEDDIIAFLNSRNIAVTEGFTCKDVTIPEEFGDVYDRYNELQKSQGFDLSGYRSREAQVYTFGVISVRGEHTDNTEAHVMVCDGKIIGGDISSPALDGGMTGF